ncbi:hypothetical protein RJ639_046187 [Escallonia herrerae]|uniref:Uncharacterized protein n=1 Tax=Escallonia herrerae TaxID=1293975 RepID=A0AA88W9I0_9ASTE|nr:hypothetical protein RJ639_046187 [Escallonia herrerae]
MAEIAMLVAEEYERRVKNSRKNGEEIDLFSCVSVLARRLGGSSVTIKSKLAGGSMEALEPKTQIGLAAINGFFSA